MPHPQTATTAPLDQTANRPESPASQKPISQEVAAAETEESPMLSALHGLRALPDDMSALEATPDTQTEAPLEAEPDDLATTGNTPYSDQTASLTDQDGRLLEPADDQTAEQHGPDLAPPVKVKVARGDTLMNLLVKAGAARPEAHQAITAMSDVFDPRDLRPGQEISLSFVSADGQENDGQLHSMALRPNLSEDIQVTLDADGLFQANSVARDLVLQRDSAEGIIESSLALAASEAGVPARTLIEAIRAFSFDVDFQREIRKGDSFEFLYESHWDREGQLARTGPLLYGSLTLSGEKVELYHFELPDGSYDYFNAAGDSVRRTLMRTPIDGARLSSGFGMRKHPVLGYSKMHRGTDFAAPTGTPIYAAGNGVIEAAGRKGSYGNYIRIRHNSSFKTAYAHMHNIAKGIKRNTRVKQGQVIGYVGTTGRSTGPHLHYEVIFNNKQVNPLTVKLPTGEKLQGEVLAQFQKRVEEIDRMRGTGGSLMVQATCKQSESGETPPGC
ncbi:MAG: peptidoglycan DD-metalloendopeptidase family protein [Pseudomonadota bacterium]